MGKLSHNFADYRNGALDRLDIAASKDDVEVRHILADAALCNLLLALNFDDVVKKFNSIDMGYGGGMEDLGEENEQD